MTKETTEELNKKKNLLFGKRRFEKTGQDTGYRQQHNRSNTRNVRKIKAADPFTCDINCSGNDRIRAQIHQHKRI